MSHDPRTQAQRPKVKPRGGGGIPPDAVIGIGLFCVLLIALGAAIAGSDDNNVEEFVAYTPTPVAVPTNTSGSELAMGDTFYTIEEIPFSFAAGIDHENPDLMNAACTVVEIGNQADGDTLSLFIEGDVYWVYATNTQNQANGWLPLNKLSETQPEDCPETIAPTEEP